MDGHGSGGEHISLPILVPFVGDKVAQAIAKVAARWLSAGAGKSASTLYQVSARCQVSLGNAMMSLVYSPAEGCQ